jgi:hypothetical protein
MIITAHSHTLRSRAPVSIIRRHNGIISVDNKKLMTSESSICGNTTDNDDCVWHARRHLLSQAHQSLQGSSVVSTQTVVFCSQYSKTDTKITECALREAALHETESTGRQFRTVEKQRSRFRMRRHALQQGECVANAIRRVRFQLWRRQQRINGDDFLQQRRNRANRMPKNRR